MKKIIHTLSVLGSLFFTCCFPGSIKAQTLAAKLDKDFQINFLKDSIEVEENSFEFNNVSISYAGPGKVDVELRMVAPSFTNILSSASVYQEITPGQQQIIPIRFNSIKNVSSERWHPFTLILLIKQTGQTIERKFWVKQKPFTKWKCFLVQPLVILKEGERKTDFFVRVENSGSTEDEYTIDFESELAIEIAKKDRKLVLPAGNSGLVKLTSVLTFQQLQQLKNAAINVYVKNSAGDKRLLVQKITRIGNRYDEGVNSWRKMPLALEFSSQNIVSGKSVYMAGLNGTLDLHGGKSLNVNVQLNNFSRAYRTNTNIYQVEYTTLKWNLAAGTFVDFDHFLINGNGLRLGYKTKANGNMELTAVRGRGVPTSQIDLKLQQPVGGKSLYSNSSFINMDAVTGTNSYLTINRFKYSLHSNTAVEVELGGGVEKHHSKTDTTTSGPMFGYQLESSHGPLTVLSTISYYSKNFPGLNKGFQYHNHELRFQQKQYVVSGFYQANRKIFAHPQDSIFRILFNTDEKEFGVRNGLSNKNFSVNLTTSLLQQQQDSANSIVSRMLKWSLSANWMLSKSLSLAVNSNLGYSRIKDTPGIAPFIGFTNFGSIQAKNFGLHLRYDSGPFYYFEIKGYAKEKLKYERLQLSPFYQKQFDNLNTFLRVELNYAYERPLNQNYLLVTNQFLYSPPRLKMDIGLFSAIDLKNNREPVVNFTVRKRLAIPVYKNDQSYSFAVVLFKDKNGNGKLDNGEQLIKNAMVLANDNWLSTETYGRIELNNVAQKVITLDFSKIGNLAGWIPKDGLVQQIQPVKNMKEVFIPFKISKIISGKLLLTIDDKSNLSMSLANIRITASDRNGTQYSTLTDADGAFSLNVPSGQYLVSINENVFDDNFKAVESSKMLDLDHNESIQLSFQIIQKRRQINIRKSD